MKTLSLLLTIGWILSSFGHPLDDQRGIRDRPATFLPWVAASESGSETDKPLDTIKDVIIEKEKPPDQKPILENEIESNELKRLHNKRNINIPQTIPSNEEPQIFGMSFAYHSDQKDVVYDENGSPNLLETMEVKIRLFGRFVKNDTYLRLTKFQQCDDPFNHEPELKVDVGPSNTMGTVSVTMPQAGELNEVFVCLKTAEMEHFVRQGESLIDGVKYMKPWLVIKIHTRLLPIWLHLALLVFLLMLSGLFSGLNLGLMALNKTDLKIISNTGTLLERTYAAAIAPVRNHGNFLLCCLLLSNVLVNCVLTILVDDLTSGVTAVIMSTLAIVIFGEIIPQAICSRHGLAVGARTIRITKFFMCITSPLAYPMSKLLNKILGEEIGNVYTRDRLKELLKVTQDYHGLETEEVGIISGALDMKTKTVLDIMVSLDSAFMLPVDAILDYDTMSDVEYHGYSRIPVYEKERKNVVGLINIKQLTLLDPNDKIPLRTVMEYYHSKLFFVFENATLYYMLKAFKTGSYGHMAFVQAIRDEGPGDPYYETMGLLTLEDVLEALLQAEIKDESDIGRSEGRKPNAIRPKTDIPSALARKQQNTHCELPAPLALAAVQFLSTSVEPFYRTLVSIPILQRLVANTAHYVKLPRHRSTSCSIPDILLYETGKPSEFFMMILEGRVEVTVGKEKLTYESGAFTTFGKDFLISALASEKTGITAPPSSPNPDKPEPIPIVQKHTFIPDYTVRVVSNIHYLMLKFSAYKSAILATTIERTNADPSQSYSKTWQDEIDKLMESMYEDETTTTTSTELPRRPKISREESVRNLTFCDNDGVIGRKISLPVLLPAPNKMILPPTIEEKDKEDKILNEQSKLLEP